MYAMITALITILVPSLAHAADAAPAAAAPTGAAGVIIAVTGLVGALGGIITAWRARQAAQAAQAQATQAQTQSAAAQTTATTAATTATTAVQVATAADTRAAQAAAWADRHANAQSDGVVLVLSYPGCRTSSRALLEVNGWRVAHYPVTQAELDAGTLLPSTRVLADVEHADAIVVEGLSAADASSLAALRDFRDRIRSGASVILFTPDHTVRYALGEWGMCDQGVTTPVTAEAAVRASLARREATARIQGVRPGQLEAARAELLGGK